MSFLSASHEADDFQDIAFMELLLLVLSFGNQFTIDFDGTGRLIHPPGVEHLLNTPRRIDNFILSVHHDLHCEAS